MSKELQSAVLSGVAIGVLATVLTLIPTAGGCLACLAYIGAGVMAVWHFSTTNQINVPAGKGVVLGLMAGVAATVIAIILADILRSVGWMPGLEETIAQMEEAGSLDAMDEGTRDTVLGLVEKMFGWVGKIVGLLIGSLAGMIGGAIGGALFKNKFEEGDAEFGDTAEV